MELEESVSKRRVGSKRKSVDIPMDVMEEILMRLPVKHVLRCKFLSKTYYALTKNPSFINKHCLYWSDSIKQNIIVAMVHNYSDNLFSVQSSSFSELYTPKTTRSKGYTMLLVGSSNGLVCAIFNRRTETETIGLWNPATREHMTIPCRPISYPYGCHMGFGYDSASDDYKLVITSNHISRAQWWSMKTNDWRDIRTEAELMTISSDSTYNMGLYIRGKLYWLVCINNYAASGKIVSFDLVHNSFRWEHTVPDTLATSEICKMKVFNLMGSLALSFAYTDSSPKFDIWVMDDCNKMWARKFTIGPFPYDYMYNRACTVDGELVITKWHSRSRFLLYDLRSKKQRLVDLSMPLENYYIDWANCSNYQESLVCVPANCSQTMVLPNSSLTAAASKIFFVDCA